MASLSLTTVSDSYTHHRTVSTKMKAINARFVDIYDAIFKKFASKFADMAHLTSVGAPQKQTILTINKKDMRQIVTEAIEEVGHKQTGQEAEVALAATVARDYFIKAQEATFEED